MEYLKKKFKKIRKAPVWAYWFPATLLKLMYKFLFHHQIDDPAGLLQTDYPKIGIIWHNRLLYFPCAINDKLRVKTSAIVSASRDGQHTSNLLHHFGIKCARGSSSRGGAHAQLEAIRELKSGRNAALTPDGPRGPVYVMKKGAIQLASITGAPLFVVSHNASAYWTFKSWDKFQIPKPGATLTLVMRGPFYIPPDLDAESIEKFRQEIEQIMKDITLD